MAYIDPTPEDIRSDFPAFAAVEDLPIQRRIDRTHSRVDEGWGEDYTYAKSLLAAHFLEEDGFSASGMDAEIASYRAAGLSSLKSASLSVAFSEKVLDDGSFGEYGATSYGRRFYALMRRLFSGVLTTGGGADCIAGASTDVPWAWRTNGWGM